MMDVQVTIEPAAIDAIVGTQIVEFVRRNTGIATWLAGLTTTQLRSAAILESREATKVMRFICEWFCRVRHLPHVEQVNVADAALRKALVVAHQTLRQRADASSSMMS
jgi:hypothetical protein